MKASTLREQLKNALRDSSDWHPRLSEHVGRITDQQSASIVRSRIYVTSASTMHSLFNILRHGQCVGSSGAIVSEDLDHIIDLNYLTHIVFRCYERDGDTEQSSPERRAVEKASRLAGDVQLDRDAAEEHRKASKVAMMFGKADAPDAKSLQKARYRVEISISPGVQVYKEDTEQKHERTHVRWPPGVLLCEENCQVSDLQIIAEKVELSQVEKFLTDVIKEYGDGDNEVELEGDEDKHSGND